MNFGKNGPFIKFFTFLPFQATQIFMIQAQKLTRLFHHNGSKIYALKDVSFTLAEGQTMAICGSSGAGKSTLLNLLGGFDAATTGTALLADHCLDKMSDSDLSSFRRKHLGFVFQDHYLLNDFTILENVMMPLLIGRIGRAQAAVRAREILNQVGIVGRDGHYPMELSGGEQQRAAIARAVIHQPKIILADEPTGNLDETNSAVVFDLLCRFNRDLGSTLIVVTHHPDFARKMDHILTLDKGKVKSFV